MEPIKELKDKKIAILGLGASQIDFVIGLENSKEWDEVWVINSAIAAFNYDRVFMMDPASRFLDTEDAGGQTDSMAKMLKEHKGPIYTCELDDRCPGLVDYPIEEVIKDTNCYYLNNTVAYSIAFALWNEVAVLKIFGVDFSYKGNLHFAEAGRGCTEFWLSKCISAGMQVEVASTSGLLDTDVPAEQKLYGYHRLSNPLVVMSDSEGLKVEKLNNLDIKKKVHQPVLIDRYDSHLMSPEPKKW